MKAFKYFKRSLKKNIRYLPTTLILTVILGFLLVLIFGFMFSFGETEKSNKTDNEKMGVGIVGDMDDKYIAPGIEMVKNLDVSEDYLDIITFDNEDEAVSALESGKIVGYMFIPENFLSSIRHGENTPAKYVSKNSPVDLGPIVVNDVLGTISNLVVESQSGIFAMENFYKENKIKGRGKALNAINLRYLGYVFSRDDFTRVIEIGETDGTTLGGYYICSLYVLIVLLVGVMCAGCLIKGNMSLPRLLSINGCRGFKQIVGEYVAFLVLPLSAVLLVCLFLGTFAGFKELGIDEFEYFEFVDYMLLFVKFVPMILVISSMQFFIYEFCTNIVSATLMQFVVSIGLAYVSGCFYPKNFFPEMLQNFSSKLPVGAGFDYSRNVLAVTDDINGAVLCFAYTAVFLVLAAVVRNIKIRSRMV